MRALKTYPLGRLQDLMQMISAVEADGYTLDDVRHFVAAKRAALARREQIRGAVLTQPCPFGCGVLLFAPVNEAPGTQTGDASTYVWTCPVCHHQEYTAETLGRIIHRLNGGRASRRRRNVRRRVRVQGRGKRGV